MDWEWLAQQFKHRYLGLDEDGKSMNRSCDTYQQRVQIFFALKNVRWLDSIPGHKVLEATVLPTVTRVTTWLDNYEMFAHLQPWNLAQ